MDQIFNKITNKFVPMFQMPNLPGHHDCIKIYFFVLIYFFLNFRSNSAQNCVSFLAISFLHFYFHTSVYSLNLSVNDIFSNTHALYEHFINVYKVSVNITFLVCLVQDFYTDWYHCRKNYFSTAFIKLFLGLKIQLAKSIQI